MRPASLQKATIKIWFSQNLGLMGWLRSQLLLGPWDRVSIQIDNRVFDVNPESGVTSMSFDAFRESAHRPTYTTVRVNDTVGLMTFLRRQLGKRFDYSDIIPSSRRAKWNKRTRWSGAELVAETLIQCGVSLDVPKGRITPTTLWVALPSVIVGPMRVHLASTK